MSKPKSTTEKRIAFLFDDRLPHDRKSHFARTATLLKSKVQVDILPGKITEEELISQLEKNSYSLVLLPWYKYLHWKKVEAFFGALRLDGPTVAGYFADAVLPFEFSQAPNYHRLILLDFYRMSQSEIELMVRVLSEPQRRSGFLGEANQNSPLFHGQWFPDDRNSTSCIDAVLKVPLLQGTTWGARSASLRMFTTALWTLCFQDRRFSGTDTPCASLEIGEFNKHLSIRMLFENADLTLKHMMDQIWPSGNKENIAMNEIIRHCDFLRVHHFPENQQIEITAVFSPEAIAAKYPGEVRGFWIEPLKKSMLKHEDSQRRVPMQIQRSEKIDESLHSVIESLRQALLQMGPSGGAHYQVQDQVSNIKFLIQEIEKRTHQDSSKKPAQKKKIA